MPTGTPNLGELLLSFLAIGVQMAIVVLFIVLAVLNRQAFRAHYKVGLCVGTACFLLFVPPTVFAMLYLDVGVLLSGGQVPRFDEGFLRIIVLIGFIVGGLILVAKIGWHMLVYCVAAAEWERLGLDAFPVLRRTGPVPWRAMFLAGAFGIVAGSASALVFFSLGVSESDGLRKLLALFPGAAAAPFPVQVVVGVLAVSVPAIVEELAFRGGVLGFLIRIGKGSRSSIIWGAVVTSFLWALLHLTNTNAPVLKCAQIFAVGLVLCEFARRKGLESAIVGHLAMNLTAVAVGLYASV